jgi:hypothetical protein
MISCGFDRSELVKNLTLVTSQENAIRYRTNNGYSFNETGLAAKYRK